MRPGEGIESPPGTPRFSRDERRPAPHSDVRAARLRPRNVCDRVSRPIPPEATWRCSVAPMGLPPRLRIPARAIRSAAGNADLRRVQAARLISVTGRWAYTVTLAVFAYRSGGAAGVAAAGIVRLGPATLVAPFTGALAARF